MLRANSRLRQTLGAAGVDFLDYAAKAIQRILPHIEVSQWQESSWEQPSSVWASPRRTGIRITLAISHEQTERRRSLSALVKRRHLPGIGSAAGKTLDKREFDICKLIALRISEVLQLGTSEPNETSIRAIRDAFDEYVVAKHVETYHGLTQMPISDVFEALHTLSEQSYENKSLTFGCVLEPKRTTKEQEAHVVKDFLSAKKYKVLSDGFRTAYRISANGNILGLVDLDRFERKQLTEKHYYPDWTEPISRSSLSGKCGIVLSRQGDILVFDNGSLRFTYRYGRWQYWNHAHLVYLHSLRPRPCTTRSSKDPWSRRWRNLPGSARCVVPAVQVGCLLFYIIANICAMWCESVTQLGTCGGW